MSLFQTKEKDGTINVLSFGTVAKDPTMSKSGKIVFFSLLYGKSKFLDCKAWADSTWGRIASRLEKKDEIGIAGVLETYTGSDGKEHSNVRVDHIMTLPMPAAPVTAPLSNLASQSAANSVDDNFSEIEDDGELPF